MKQNNKQVKEAYKKGMNVMNKKERLEEKERYFTNNNGETASIQNTNQANIDLQDAFYDDKGGEEPTPTYLVQESPAIKVTKD